MGEALAVLAALLFALGTVLQSRRLAGRVNLVDSHRRAGAGRLLHGPLHAA